MHGVNSRPPTSREDNSAAVFDPYSHRTLERIQLYVQLQAFLKYRVRGDG